MKLISNHEDTFDAEYVYKHKSFTIKETHHSVIVYLDNEEIASFNNLKEAVKFINRKEKVC